MQQSNNTTKNNPFVERKRREYDIVKLHALYLENVQEKESERLDAELKRSRAELDATSTGHLRGKIKSEIKRLERAQASDHSVNYLLESIPILNEFHACNAQLANARRNQDRDRISDFSRQRQIIITGYLRRFYPRFLEDAQIDRNEAFRETKALVCCGLPCIQNEDCSVVCSKCGLVVLNSQTVDMANPSRNLSYSRNVSAASSFSYKRCVSCRVCFVY